MASSSSSSSCSASGHDVFLSFRGEDTRLNFTSHLYDALCRNDINAYIDDQRLERGDEISQALKEAIERSKISIVIFSKNYASSSWCLDELVHILHCHQTNDQIVLPVFYEVDPSDVRKQRGSYQTALVKHEDKGKVIFFARKGKSKVVQWRNALTTVANLAGWDLQVIRSECELVNKIVKDILKKLNRISSSNDFMTGLVGIERRIKKIEDVLCIGSSEVRAVGIWGPGGIGKTTLARIVFHRLSSKFEACCFLEDIRVDWIEGQRRYYHSKNSLFNHKLLRNKKVLAVFDNVNDPEQLEILAKDNDLFGPGSRIIITARDMQMLRGEVDEIYKVERLDFDEALQLFRLNAFKKTCPTSQCTEVLSTRSINYAEGLPLALKVLSSFLRGKRGENWEAELDKLIQCPNKKIMNILRTSYDGLDEMQKCIFLDIACFFKDAFRDDVERILDACGLCPKIGIDDLVDKSLISIKLDNKVWMHDLIQQMAWDIVKSTKEIERYSRLWISEDACRVLETTRGTSTIEGIVLDMSKINRIDFNPAAFREMYNLRLLKIFHSDIRKKCEVSADQGNRDLLFSANLRYLHWEEYPWRYFPPCFRAENLVELVMPYSKVTQLWEGIQLLGSLKKIDLSRSKNLTKLPDLSRALHLENIYLYECTSLQQFPSSLQHLDDLKTLALSGCSSIHKFPKLPKNIIGLMLDGTGIRHVPPSIQHLDRLELLTLPYVASLPSFLVMQSLKFVDLPTFPVIPWWIFRVTKHDKGTFGNQYFSSGRGCLRGVDDYAMETVSISRPAFAREYLNGFRRHGRKLLLFNWFGLYHEKGLKMEAFEEKLKDFSTGFALSETKKGVSIKADIGVCSLRNKIPEWFHHRCNGDTVDVSDKRINNLFPNLRYGNKPSWNRTNAAMGFAACAIVRFSQDYEDYNDFEEFKLLCQPIFPRAYTRRDDDGEIYYDHRMLVNYSPKEDSRRNIFSYLVNNPVANVLLKFRCVDQDYQEFKGVKIEECGIHILCAEGADGTLEFNGQDSWKFEEME